MNGAQKIVSAMKNVSNSNKTPQSEIISATVISINPLKFQLENRLEIDSSFYELSNLEDWKNIEVGTKVRGFSFNEGQKYYISDIAENKDYSLASINETLQAIINGDIEISSSSGGAPIGSCMIYFGTIAPENYMFVDGSELSRTDYEELFALIGTTYGTGDKSTTFNLPDMREAVPMMKGDTYSTLGELVGSNTKSIAKANLPNYTLYNASHAHTQAGHSHTTTHYCGVYTTGSSHGTGTINSLKSGSYVNYSTNSVQPAINGTTIKVTSGGSDTPFNVMQKTLVCNYIIKVK